MIGADPSLRVSPDDDAYHPPTSGDPSWIETMWFPFWIADEGISIHVRAWLSPNAGAQGAAVSAWRGDGQVVFGDGWSEPFSEAPDLLDLRLARGLRIEQVEPLRRYRVRHSGKGIDLDVTFEATLPAHPVAPEESPGMFAGHFEQPGHIAGVLRHGGREYAIDCHSVRDRSWGPRIAKPDLRIGNAHGTARDFAFFAYVNPTAEGVERVTSGYLLRDGVAAEIVGGERTTRLQGDFPRAIALSLEDAAGRRCALEGTCENRAARNAGNGVYAVLNLVRWQHEAGVVWGENHDVWSEAAWLAAGRAKL